MSEWISVKDRLPEFETEVLLVFRRWCEYEYGKPTIGMGYKLYLSKQGAIFSGVPELSNVTHWMPLPELPEE